MRFTIHIISLLLSSILVTTSYQIVAQTMDLSASKDATIFLGNTSGSNGGGNLFAGSTTGKQSSSNRRALIQFDVSSIPANAIVVSASLSITGNKDKGGAQTFNIYRLIGDWGEATTVGTGSGGGKPSAAQTGDATWSHAFFNTTAWTNAGGDYIASSSGSASIGDGVTGTFNTTTLKNDVQGWVNGSLSNFGWIIKGNEGSSGTAVRMNPHDVPSNQPVLSVTYTVPAVGTAIVNEVNPNSKWVELYNPTADPVDVSSWWLVNGASSSQISVLTVLNGNTNLVGSSYVVLSFPDMTGTDGETGLYSTDASSFNNDIVDYVIYGSPVSNHAAVAVGAGVWDNASNSLTAPEGTNSLGLKIGGGYTSGSDTDSTDWEEQDTSQGVQNAPCPAILALMGAITTGTYNASQKLNATGTLGNTQNVTFKAGNEVNIQAEFTLDSGGILQILLENCNI